MNDLRRALSDISDIRGQIVASTCFRGLGPAALAATGALAFVTAVAQHLWLDDPGGQPMIYFAGWVATAVFSVAIIGIEMFRRARRIHAALADDMIFGAALRFLPAGIAGLGLALVLLRFAPETVWMLPGLWAILVGLGIFAFARALPGMMILAGAWYFVAGFAVLMVAARDHALSPMLMAVPFVIGQFLLALLARLAAGGLVEED